MSALTDICESLRRCLAEERKISHDFEHSQLEVVDLAEGALAALEELASLVRHASPLSLTYGPEQSCHRIGPGRLVDQRAWEQWCKKWGQEA